MNLSLVNGADMALIARKSPMKSFDFDTYPHNDSSNQLVDSMDDQNNEFLAVLKVTNLSSRGYNKFPLNIVAFFTILSVKIIGFQMNLCMKFFSFPIWFSYSIMVFLFPFQTLSRIRKYFRRKIMGIFYGFYFGVTSFIYRKIKAQMYVLKLGIKCGCVAFWGMYLCVLLFLLLAISFVIGGIMMKRLIEMPIQRTEPLHFDYTKASPAAFVPIDGGMGAAEGSGARAIAFNHKLQLTVFLTLPESDYNKKLGIFQVKVEYMSAKGKIVGSSSYPCMLKFKSLPIRVIETIIKSVPLIAGFQSEVQNLEVKINDFTEGHDPTSSLRVSLEQRAEYKYGAGIPEVYSASVYLSSELPGFKKIVWSWRRTIFVLISLMSFVMELIFMLIFCRPVVIPRGRLIVIAHWG